MKLTCPSCGAVHSVEGWQNDASARQCIALIADIPGGAHVLQYLALFRPVTGRGLAWTRALRLVKELSGKIASDHIQIGQKPARPITPDAWCQALERIVESPPQRLPLKSHGYLAAIAYDIADEADRSNERSKREAENSGRFRSKTGASAEPERISMEELREIREKNFKRKGFKDSRIQGGE